MALKEEAISKIKQYCAYQERCKLEVKEKLFSFDLSKEDIEDIIAGLIETNYLNEERFAIQFSGGKFRIKQWGKVKIKYALKQKQVNDIYIKKALDQIDDNEYSQALEKLASKKSITLKGETNIFTRKKKLQSFLLQKGYEIYLVNEVVEEVIK